MIVLPLLVALAGPATYLEAPVDGSLYGTMQAQAGAKLGEVMSAYLQRLLMWNLDLRRQVHKGDRIRMVYDAETGDIRALAYDSQQLKRVLWAFAFKPASQPFLHYYDETGQQLEQHIDDGPLDDWEQITSLIGDGRGHAGMDFKTPEGSPVKLPFAARVVRTNWHTRANGNCVEVHYDRGQDALFLHLQHVADGVKPGAHLAPGTLVGLSGNTGHSTAPHLHYQLMNGRHVLDPLVVHGSHKVSVAEADRAAFEATRAQLLLLLGPAAR